MDSEYLESCQKDELTNPEGVCIVCGKKDVHKECEKGFVEERHLREQMYAQSQMEAYERDREKLNKYSLSGNFGCVDENSKLEFLKILEHLQKAYPEAHSYNFGRVIENQNWWFVPRFYIGLIGYIVEKEPKSIYPVGSGYGDVWSGIECYLNGEILSENS